MPMLLGVVKPRTIGPIDPPPKNREFSSGQPFLLSAKWAMGFPRPAFAFINRKDQLQGMPKVAEVGSLLMWVVF
jgi:hypothetical protein